MPRLPSRPIFIGLAIALFVASLGAGRLPGPALAAAPDGQTIFNQKCASCHQADGKGTGPFPPLAGDPFVTAADVKPLIATVLNGRTGQVTILGQSYSVPMPAAALSNADLAAVLTYIRSAWNNKASAVTEQQVAAAGPSASTTAGAAIYASRCASCHKANGQGVTGAYPALAGDAQVNAANPRALIVTVKRGHTSMPSWSLLSDADVAAVLTYVRSAWGNNGAPIAERDVTATIY